MSQKLQIAVEYGPISIYINLISQSLYQLFINLFREAYINLYP